MISVEDALDQLFQLVTPLESQIVPLPQAAGRLLASDVIAHRDQPPFAASAMDGYAICKADFAVGTRLDVIGESAAGARFKGPVASGEAVRIFTGAPLPKGADWVVIQEDVTVQGAQITIADTTETSAYIRPVGTDFKAGHRLDAKQWITPQLSALLAAMNCAEVSVVRRPEVAIISTGTELVMPGEIPGEDQIIASNTFGLKAMLENAGADVRILPIAHDTPSAVQMAFQLAQGADLIVTIGGASVGDHDLVAPVAEALGMERAFYKVAMRPGKPLMAGKLNGAAMIGLPGNPVSAMVCGTVFVIPMLRAMLGLGQTGAKHHNAILACDLPENGPRAHYMRATLKDGEITPFDRQDSALLSVLSQANALLLRPPKDPALRAGSQVSFVPL